MITRAIITSIFGNKCTVKVPLFANDNSNEIPTISDVVMSIPPGMIGQYAENDVVFLGFEENMLNRPVILGKLYTGSKMDQSISLQYLPIDTKFNYSNIDDRANAQTIQSLQDLITAVNKLQIQVNTLIAQPTQQSTPNTNQD